MVHVYRGLDGGKCRHSRSPFLFSDFLNFPFDSVTRTGAARGPLISPLFSASNTGDTGDPLVTLFVCVYDPQPRSRICILGARFFSWECLWKGLLDWARFRDSIPCSPLSVAHWHLHSHLSRGWTCHRGWGTRGYRGSGIDSVTWILIFLFLFLTMYGLIGSTRNIAIRWGLSFETLTEEPMTPCGLPFFHVAPRWHTSWIPVLLLSRTSSPSSGELISSRFTYFPPSQLSRKEVTHQTGLGWYNTYEQHIEKLLISRTPQGLDV